MTVGNFGGAFIPILFGPVAEYEVTPQFALTGELKMGPHIGVGDVFGGTTTFGFKFQVGGVLYF
ncbi:MAG: hypothetical protein HC826_00480 [Rhodospirillales bacterium]|nr:hypothetical protein [Rhodospirillales bacterium]